VFRWYAVYTRQGMELWARSNLWQRGFDVYLPRYRKVRRHARRTETVSVPLFPRYLFVRADLEEGGRRAIDSAAGVSHLVAFGGRPAPVADRIIDEIRGREGDDGFVRLAALAEDYRCGDRLRIDAGAMCDRVGLFHCRADKERVVILLDLLGRQLRVRVPAEYLSRES